MNSYYNFERKAEIETLVDAFDYNHEMSKIEDAFDGIPPVSQLLSGTLNFSTDTGAANAYQATMVTIPAGVPYEPGNNVALLTANTATGPGELQVNDKGFVPIKMPVFGDMVAGDFVAGGIFTSVFDGVNFQSIEMSPRYILVATGKAGETALSAANAASSASDAADAAADANDSANLTATYVAPANNSASSAAGSASSAAGSASSAAGSASSAAGSASTASSRATAAANSATNAGNSATAAAGSATAAANSATNAGNSATAAAGSATAADAAADEAEDRFSDPAFLQMVNDLIIDLEYPVGVLETFAVTDDPNDMYPGTVWTVLPPGWTLRTCAANGSDIMQQVGANIISLLASHLPAHSHSVNNATTSSYDYESISTNNLNLGSKTTSSFDYGTKATVAFDYGTKTTSTFDHGTKTSNGNGGHSHNLLGDTAHGSSSGSRDVVGRQGSTSVSGRISSVGDHTHTVAIGTHSHSVAIGSHSHNVAIGSHTHAAISVGSHSHNVAIGSHTHSATAVIGSTGSGNSFSVLNSSINIRVWRRTG